MLIRLHTAVSPLRYLATRHCLPILPLWRSWLNTLTHAILSLPPFTIVVIYLTLCHIFLCCYAMSRLLIYYHGILPLSSRYSVGHFTSHGWLLPPLRRGQHMPELTCFMTYASFVTLPYEQEYHYMRCFFAALLLLRIPAYVESSVTIHNLLAPSQRYTHWSCLFMRYGRFYRRFAII